MSRRNVATYGCRGGWKRAFYARRTDFVLAWQVEICYPVGSKEGARQPSGTGFTLFVTLANNLNYAVHNRS